jgi:DNA-binding response OmpR family regulator
VTRVLVVEDDPRISSFLDKGLRASGFAAVLAETAALAQHLCTTEEFDIIVLDMGLPGGDGLDVLRHLRALGRSVPVIVLTGLPERDVVTCLEAGADDYMRKPFAFDELLARIRTRLRHSGTGTGFFLEAGGIHLDLRTRRATVKGRQIDFTNREFALLETFMRHPDHVLAREQLLSQVWGYDFDPTTNLVNVYINALRKKIGAEMIDTVRGAGYRFNATRNATATPGT